MIYLNAIASLVLLSCAGADASGMALTKDGKSAYVIAVGPDAIESEKTAASELQGFIEKVTGAKLPIRTESDVAGDAPRILVGASAEAKRLCPGVDWTALGQDGIVLKTSGKHLVLAGGRPRGALYAAYTFLEDVVGCRWWTSTESTIPKKPDLTMPELNVTYTPKLRYREAFYRDVTHYPIFAARLKCNGHFEQIPPSHGGHYTILGWCHTFYMLLPPEKYFKDHSEWYSEINGKRVHEGAQLCLTNDEMRMALTAAALDWIRKSPQAGIIDISQNDWHGQCQCAKCKAVEQEEGSPAGPLIRFVNAIAADVEKAFPDFLVQTLAYQYTRKPPSKVRPRRNVVIRLCSIECDFGHPLDSEANATFRNDINGWSRISPNLAIWNYVTNFRNYILPHPNMRSLADDLRYFVKHGAVSVFEQGDNGCGIGDFVRLRAWVLSRLMWDPSRDQEGLIREFLTGYYGPAGTPLGEYLTLLHGAFEKRGKQLRCYNEDLSFLTLDDLVHASALFDRAAKAVAADPVLTGRVRRERLPLDLAKLLRYASLETRARLTTTSMPWRLDPIQAREAFIRLARELDVGQYREGRPFDDYQSYLESLFRAPAPPPERCKALSPDRWLDVQDNRFTLHGQGNWVRLVEDPQASDGRAACMPGGHTQWATQWEVPSDLADLGATWRCYVVVKCQPKSKTGTAFSLGLYDQEGRRGVASKAIPLAEAPAGEYRDYDLGPHVLKSGMYLWVAPPGNAESVEAVYVDRIYLVRE
ncbi:MAG: DUF4838 domain-containing protein [Phycisphaerae bacterium]|nr:DUF4838 domain-containing protein [Phycisphaerae bacterium]